MVIEKDGGGGDSTVSTVSTVSFGCVINGIYDGPSNLPAFVQRVI